MSINVDYNWLRSFVMLAKSGSFSRAAKVLGVPKSKLSRHVARLEDVLGEALVYRTTRQVELTQLGAKLFSNLQSDFSSIDAVLQKTVQSHAEVKGTLRLTAPEDIGSLIFTRIISEFASYYPQVNFELLYTDRVLDLVAESIDLAFRVGPPQQKSLKIRKIADIHFMVIANDLYLQRHSKPFTVKDLQHADFISYLPARKPIQLFNGKKNFKFNMIPKYQSGSMWALCELACQGSGVAIVPKFLGRKAIKEGRAVEVCHGWAPKPRPLIAATFAQRGTSPLVRKFIQFGSERVPEILNA